MGPGVVARRLAALLLVVASLGLPIDDLVAYALLVAAALVIFTGRPSTEGARWTAALALTAAVVAGHVLWPTPRIDEGHNIFLPGASAQTSGIPADVLKVMSRQFDERYPPEKRCDDQAKGCWRPDRTAEADGYEFSADGIFQRPASGPAYSRQAYSRQAYSRQVTGIDFSDPVYLRLGVINELAYAWPDHSSDIMRFDRDRRSLNLFDRYRMALPVFIVYRFPAAFAGSRLCWQGTVLWETEGERFDDLSSAGRQCRDITPADVGRRIYAISIAPDVRLGMTLAPNRAILLWRALASGLTLAGAIGIVVLLVRIAPRRLALPVTLMALTLLLVLFIDAQFIGGFRPLDSGDDGLTYEGFARRIVRHLLSGDFAAALKGEENVYYFSPGLRYFRVLERFLFGDTFLGYLSMILAFPLLVFALFRRFLTRAGRW